MRYNGELVTTLNTSRLQELLTYLVINCNSPQSRQYLAFLFWPDSTEKHALNNLRQLLFQLRNELPEADYFLKVDTKTLRWNSKSDFALDVFEFDHCLAKAEEAEKAGNTSVQEKQLVEAVELYKGELLTSCYEEWIVPSRERLNQAYLGALKQLVDLMEAKRDYNSALFYSRKLLQSDQLRESTHRRIMRLYALMGDMAKALQAYEQCRKVLKRELAIEPGSETQSLIQRIQASHSTEADGPLKRGTIPGIDYCRMVDRKEEWNTLVDCWKAAINGNRQAVFISGEPGIGKTRLGRELLNYVSRQGYPSAYTKSYEAAGTLSYGAVTDWLRQEPIKNQLAELEPFWLQELVRLLPELLSEYRDLSHPGAIRESWQKKQFWEAITRGVLGNGKPRLLMLDDLQWCDGETLAWLEHLFYFDPSTKLLVVGMYRPAEARANDPLRELIATLRREGCLSEIALSNLDEVQTTELMSMMTNANMSQEDISYLYRETEGNPLFVIESVREGKYKGIGAKGKPLLGVRVKADQIPSKVKEVILARFESISQDTRELMELAATIGREFSFTVLTKASTRAETVVVKQLDELLEHHIIRELKSEVYDFSHDKIREVAYLEMSSAKKRLFHKLIAEAIEVIYGKTADQQYSQLAFHFDRSKQPEKAIFYYKKAAQAARNIFAYDVAINYLKRGLELLQKYAVGEQKDRLERNLQTDLSLSLYPLQGYSGEEVLKRCDRILDLCNKLKEQPAAPVMRFLAIGNITTGNFDKAIELGLRLYDHAKKFNDSVELVEADYVLGSAMNWKGNFKEAKKYFAEGIDKYNPNLQQQHIQRYGQNPMLICKIRLAGILWIFGETENAKRLEEEVLDDAVTINHPFSLSYVFGWSCLLHYLKGNIGQSLAMAERYFQEPIHGEFTAWRANIKALYGAALVKSGQQEKGINLIRDGLKINQQINVGIFSTYFSCLLAEALADQNKFEEAFSLLDEAFGIIKKTGERWLESEMYRIKGHIYLKVDPKNSSEAGRCFQAALDVAKAQGAEPFELKAMHSLKMVTL